MTRRILFTTIALAMASPLVADAASGTIRGHWRNYQNQGNYCDASTRDCTGARYLETEYHTYHPISDTKIYVKDPDGVVIGTGATDINGLFNITWNRASTPAHVRVYWQFEHKDDRFKIRNDANAVLAKWTGEIAVVNGGTVDTGDLLAGTASAISGLANIYDGADRMWNDSLRFSNRMLATFTGLTIRAYSDDCPTACANGGGNYVKMPEGSEFRPQARIMHEMGHIASYVAAGGGLDPGSYCYPDGAEVDGKCPSGTDGWAFGSTEWRGVALKEGMATLFGDIALYWFNAVDPRSCLSSGECPLSGSIEATATCSGEVGRTALQMDRYLWDIYDSAQDGSDQTQIPYGGFFDTLAAIPEGFDWGERQSYRTSGGTVDCWDCFHSWEWRNAMLEHWVGAVDTQDEYFQNCMGFF